MPFQRIGVCNVEVSYRLAISKVRCLNTPAHQLLCLPVKVLYEPASADSKVEIKARLAIAAVGG